MQTDDDDLDDDDDDLDDTEAAIVREAAEEALPVVTEAQIQEMLADPTFARIAATAVQRYEGIMTDKGLERARRTLAVVFLTDPRAAEALARAREAGPLDRSGDSVKEGAATAPLRRSQW